MKLYPLDTSLVLNTATSAIQAKKTDEAVMYYRKLTDADVAGKDYEEVYEFLVDHYSKRMMMPTCLKCLQRPRNSTRPMITGPMLRYAR